jgi:hypothetical protein
MCVQCLDLGLLDWTDILPLAFKRMASKAALLTAIKSMAIVFMEVVSTVMKR